MNVVTDRVNIRSQRNDLIRNPIIMSFENGFSIDLLRLRLDSQLIVIFFSRMLFRYVLHEKSRSRRSKRFAQYQDAAWGE